MACLAFFLCAPIDVASTQKLMALRTDSDDFADHGREIYWLCSMKQSESTFSNALLEKTLKIQAAMRGMKPIQKLAVKYNL